MAATSSLASFLSRDKALVGAMTSSLLLEGETEASRLHQGARDR